MHFDTGGVLWASPGCGGSALASDLHKAFVDLMSVNDDEEII